MKAKKSILICWIGFADLKASKNESQDGMGPIGQAVRELDFDEIVLISDLSETDTKKYIKWLKTHTETKIKIFTAALSGPTHFGEIYKTATDVILRTLKRHGGNVKLTYHLSPGTPAMAAVWIIIAKTRFPATLIESSLKKGVKIAFGTDAGVFNHGENGEEFGYMVEAGMPAMEAIQSATITNANILGMKDKIGQLEVGFLADIVATDEDPTQNINTMENVSFVMKEGKIYKN